MLAFVSAIMIGSLSIVTYAESFAPRYAVGRVSYIANTSQVGKLELRATVPSPTSDLSHRIARNAYIQNCSPTNCADYPYEVVSDWSVYGAHLLKWDESHGDYDRKEHVEGYKMN